MLLVGSHRSDVTGQGVERVCLFHPYADPVLCRKPVPLVLDQDYVNLKNQIIKAERRVLKELGFCVHVKHPHKVGTRPRAPRAHLSRGCVLTHPKTLTRVQRSLPWVSPS